MQTIAKKVISIWVEKSHFSIFPQLNCLLFKLLNVSIQYVVYVWYLWHLNSIIQSFQESKLSTLFAYFLHFSIVVKLLYFCFSSSFSVYLSIYLCLSVRSRLQLQFRIRSGSLVTILIKRKEKDLKILRLSQLRNKKNKNTWKISGGDFEI